MCEPTTIALGIAAGATLASSASSASSSRQSGAYNKAVAETNAKLADQAAHDATVRGSIAASNQRAKGTMVEGQQKAAIAGNGIDVQSGSALDLLSSTKLMSEIDAQTIEANAAREAYGYKTQGIGYRAQGKLTEMSADSQATGTLLGGLAGTATMVGKIR